MKPWKTQQMSPSLLLMTSTSSWKLLLVIHNVSMERMKETIELLITLLYKALWILINLKTNSDVQHRHQHTYIDENSTVH